MGQTTPERERLARFLVGRLPSPEAETIANSLFENEGMLAEMEGVERDLLDAYAAGSLSGAEKLDVHRRLLTSDAQREKLRFAFALAGSRRVRTVAPMLWAAAAVVFIVLAGSAWWITRLSSERDSLRAELATARRPAAPVADGPTAAFLLSPVDRSAPEERLAPGSAVSLIRLNLAIQTETEIADVVVRAASGALVLEQHGVPAQSVSGSKYVSLWIPNAALPPGSYSVSVTNGEKPQEEYAFRIVRPN